MRLGHIELFVRDLEVARRFYVDVLGCKHVAPEMTHVTWLELEGITILLRPGTPPRPPDSYQGVPAGFALYTDGLDATMARLRDRGLTFRGTDGSDRCPTFTDPDGNWFQLVDPKEM